MKSVSWFSGPSLGKEIGSGLSDASFRRSTANRWTCVAKGKGEEAVMQAFHAAEKERAAGDLFGEIVSSSSRSGLSMWDLPVVALIQLNTAGCALVDQTHFGEAPSERGLGTASSIAFVLAPESKALRMMRPVAKAWEKAVAPVAGSGGPASVGIPRVIAAALKQTPLQKGGRMWGAMHAADARDWALSRTDSIDNVVQVQLFERLQDSMPRVVANCVFGEIGSGSVSVARSLAGSSSAELLSFLNLSHEDALSKPHEAASATGGTSPSAFDRCVDALVRAVGKMLQSGGGSADCNLVVALPPGSAPGDIISMMQAAQAALHPDTAVL